MGVRKCQVLCNGTLAVKRYEVTLLCIILSMCGVRWHLRAAFLPVPRYLTSH